MALVDYVALGGIQRRRSFSFLDDGVRISASVAQAQNVLPWTSPSRTSRFFSKRKSDVRGAPYPRLRLPIPAAPSGLHLAVVGLVSSVNRYFPDSDTVSRYVIPGALVFFG